MTTSVYATPSDLFPAVPNLRFLGPELHMDIYQREFGDAPQPECPTCGAAEARPVAVVRPIVYVRCPQCETAWSFRDRRQARFADAELLAQLPRNADLN